MGSVINRDIPPYVMVGGSPTKPHGINAVGLERQSFTPEAIRHIKKAYKIIYKSGLKLDDALKALAALSAEVPEIGPIVAFLEQSGRSIIR